jgi:predicted O-methyltransferase YrrM
MNRIFKRIRIRFLRSIIGLDKQTALKILRSMEYDNIVMGFNDHSKFEWAEFKPGKRPEGFEDLTGLFFCSPLNRGILRQDLDEAALLFRYVSQIASPRGVEIGRYYGGSTVLLAAAIGKAGKLYSIDICPNNQDKELIDVLKETDLSGRVELIINDANLIEINDDLDFAFIDGDHTYEGARLDHNRWGKKIKEGGILIHHDMGKSRNYSTQISDLEELYNDILHYQKDCLEVIATAGSMVVFRKSGNTWKEIPPRT